MPKNLVIVESPAKAKTIEKFLGKDYRVMSSYGHIRDLSKKDFAIDEAGHFTPDYEVPEDKNDLVNRLRKAASEAEVVWLASDEDREGEAIAWHLFEVLGLNPATTRRIVFHEITKAAILHAIANPRDIDLPRVDAQQARRVLDRIVGFELSPVLWRKIRPTLSAGRVQSVAVRLIVERENEIKAFKPEPYYSVSAHLLTPDGHPLRAILGHRLPDRESAEQLLRKFGSSTFTVGDVEVRPVKKSPAPPFTTSTLQQEASRRLGFPVTQTMMVAQRLYEAGHITYMRTDSLNLSNEALTAIGNEITERYGVEYHTPRHYHTSSKGAQEAHEAIRPTYIDREDIPGANERERRLYRLIRQRTLACQMSDARIEKTTVQIVPDHTPDTPLAATGETIRFEGYLRAYQAAEQMDTDNEGAEPNSPESGSEAVLPPLEKGEILTAKTIVAAEKLTQHPPRYSEATLVKKLEELGIGRPSTYAPTISTIQQRGYVERATRPGTPVILTTLTLNPAESPEPVVTTAETAVGADRSRLVPTDIGVVVNDFLTSFFPNVLDYNFTAKVEERFDLIAEGQADWQNEIAEFYGVFHPEVIRAGETRFEHRPGERVLGTEPSSGRLVSVKIGRYGPVVQIGESSDEDKPKFAPVPKELSISDITLEQALDLFKLPRTLGEVEGQQLTVASGRFGPYARLGNTFVSIPADIDPCEITLEMAMELIAERRAADAARVVKSFDEAPDIKLVRGRFGIYIATDGQNYKIPNLSAKKKEIPAELQGLPEDPAELTLEQCRAIIAATPAKSTKKSAAKSSTSAKKSTAKKSSGKKSTSKKSGIKASE